MRGRRFQLIALTTFLFIAAIRLYKIGLVPQGLNIDEAAYAYESYSLAETGQDTWGQPWPLTLTSFGDNKPAGLSYAALPFIKLFGLNSFSIRLPSALTDLVTVIILFFTLQLFSRRAYLNLGLSAIYALSPWTFGITRLFYETNIGLTFIALAIMLLVKSLQSRSNHHLSLAFGSLAFAGYFYAVFRYVALAFVGLFIYLKRKHSLPQTFASLRRPLLTYLLVALPLLFLMFSSTGLKRLTQEGELRDFGHGLVVQENREMCYLSAFGNRLISRPCYLFWNRPLENLSATFQAVVDLASPSYLFFEGTQPDIIPAGHGAYLSWLLPFYLIGLYSAIQQSIKSKKPSQFLLIAYLLSLLPVASAQVVMIHRNAIGLYLAFIFIGLGLHHTASLTKKYLPRYQQLLALFLLILGIFSTARYQFEYHLIYTNLRPDIFNYDSQQVYDYVIDHQEEYDLIIDRAHVDGPLYYAFYSQLDPNIYQMEAIKNPPNKNGWIHNHQLLNIQNGGSSVPELLCERYRDGEEYPHTLVISEPQKDFTGYALLSTRSFNQVHTLHELYDINLLYSELTNKKIIDFSTYCKRYLK